MATYHVLYTLSITHFIFLSLLAASSTTIPLTSPSNDIHDLLRSKGLPAGLFPSNEISSFDLDENDHLTVYFQQPCMAKFENRVFFDSVVRANLSYGRLIGVQGLSQEELFLWFPVKHIIVKDPSSGLILFDIGFAHKQFALSLFEDPRVCDPQGVTLGNFGIRKLGYEAQR